MPLFHLLPNNQFNLVDIPSNMWQALGSFQVTIHCLLILFCIYVIDVIILPDLFKHSLTNQFIMSFICIFHQMCMLRNLYKSLYTISNVDDNFTESTAKYKDECTICKVCEQLRPRRSHHCSVCDKCIDKLDHHCFMLNNCIGRKNYRYFFSYLFLTFINAFIAFVLCLASTWDVKAILQRLQKERVKIYFIDILLNIPVRACIVLVISCVIMLYMGYMLCYHLFLLNRDITTIEMKYKVLRVDITKKKKRNFKEKFFNMLHGDNLFDLYLPE